jgi:hypothetical protein
MCFLMGGHHKLHVAQDHSSAHGNQRGGIRIHYVREADGIEHVYFLHELKGKFVSPLCATKQAFSAKIRKIIVQVLT